MEEALISSGDTKHGKASIQSVGVMTMTMIDVEVGVGKNVLVHKFSKFVFFCCLLLSHLPGSLFEVMLVGLALMTNYFSIIEVEAEHYSFLD